MASSVDGQPRLPGIEQGVTQKRGVGKPRDKNPSEGALKQRARSEKKRRADEELKFQLDRTQKELKALRRELEDFRNQTNDTSTGNSEAIWRSYAHYLELICRQLTESITVMNQGDEKDLQAILLRFIQWLLDQINEKKRNRDGLDYDTPIAVADPELIDFLRKWHSNAAESQHRALTRCFNWDEYSKFLVKYDIEDVEMSQAEWKNHVLKGQLKQKHQELEEAKELYRLKSKENEELYELLFHYVDEHLESYLSASLQHDAPERLEMAEINPAVEQSSMASDPRVQQTHHELSSLREQQQGNVQEQVLAPPQQRPQTQQDVWDQIQHYVDLEQQQQQQESRQLSCQQQQPQSATNGSPVIHWVQTVIG